MQVAIPFMARIDDATMERAPALKLILQYGVGVEGIDMAAVSCLLRVLQMSPEHCPPSHDMTCHAAVLKAPPCMRCCSQQPQPAIAIAVAAMHAALMCVHQVGPPCRPPQNGDKPCPVLRCARHLQHTWHSHPA